MEGDPLPQPGPRRGGAADPAPERIQDLRPDRARAGEPRPRSRRCSPVMATTPTSSAATTRARSTRGFAATLAECRSTIRRDPGRRPGRRPRPACAGRRSCCGRRRAGPGRRRSTACRSRAPSAPTRCRSDRSARTPSTWRCSRSGCAPTAPRSTSTRAAGSPAPPPRLHRRGRSGWARPATPTAAGDWCRCGSRSRRGYAFEVEAPGAARAESTRRLGELLRDVYRANAEAANFRLFCPDETNSNRLGAVFEVEDRCLADAAPEDEHVSPARSGDGGPLRAQLPGLAGGLPADRSPRPVRHLRGLRDGLRLDGDPAHQVAGGDAPARLAGARRLAQRAAHLDLLAQRPQRLQPPGPGPDRHDADPARRGRADLLPARRQLPADRRRPLPAQPRLRQPDRDRQAAPAAVPELRGGGRARAASGPRAGAGRATGTDEPDVVLACRRRHPDDGDRRRRRAAAPRRAGAAASGSSTSST